ncbi:hypothetical protein PHLGIDRAFT_121274 [Phlebiopsis gigantea 11061_1 CR5-6]|uniref:Uncharacterized protein n=1 Tax=Phlebiopsis gigantea (strain 11061_1 CR5-6) TaxID=745531 RepID=A0A0C3PEE8_PHLG1|nr:hypothetical protein PHLGIDRAFT_121274 [Phlebiopsis gigantea 11061_1 CR5-6]
MREALGYCDTTLSPLEKLRLKFVLEWPGCTKYVPAYTKHGADRSIWTAARLAHEVARAVHNFYEMFENHLDMRRPADDWTPDRIPFDKLYLLELRQVSTRVLQPVLYYDAD